MTPIFIFSLPRSGSTLLQRILATQPEIATLSEPWILLPLLYSTRSHGIYAEYVHSMASLAIRDFVAELPARELDFLNAARNFALHLYEKASSADARYFLDKTPRYHLVAEDILRMFPRAKFIFLWRNPLAVAASIINTWGNGKWILYRYKIDLFDGLTKLITAFESHQDIALSLNYENLIANPGTELHRLSEYLGIEFNEVSLSRFPDVKLTGRLGDHTGIRDYNSVSSEPTEKWINTLKYPLRKAWCRRYLKWLGNERAQSIGYDTERLLAELDGTPFSVGHLISDCLKSIEGVAVNWLEPVILRDKFRMLPDTRSVHAHR